MPLIVKSKFAEGDTIANIDAPDPMADITQKVASLESVGLGRAAELRIGPLEPRSTSLPCTTRYFDLQHRRRGAAAEVQTSGARPNRARSGGSKQPKTAF